MTNAVALRTSDLPDTFVDLSRFVLVGREKLVAVRAEINAIRKVGLAKDVLEQKKSEAQDIAELVTMAEVKIGKMLKDIPKASGGDRKSDAFKNHPMMNFETEEEIEEDDETQNKSQVIESLGFNRNQVSQFQRMADNEDIVRDAIEEARTNDDIISRSQVLKKIDEAEHKPHISFNSGNNEWYTPADIIEAARGVMDGIDVDPASSDIAQETVKAKTYYTAETNGLDKDWIGNVWMNPPYAGELIGLFVDKLLSEIDCGNTNAAVVLVNNATETEWFCRMIDYATAVCFPKSRVKFYMPDGRKGAPLQGQALLYFGVNVKGFCKEFSKFGWCAIPE